MDVDAESRSGEPHSHLAEKHRPLHRWQNFALLCTFFAPSSAQIAIFFIFPELCIFLLRRGAWWGGPLGFLMAGAPYLTLKLWQTFLSHLKFWNPEVPGLKQRQREEQYSGGLVLHWRGLAAPEVPRYVDQVGAQ